jgi:PncC family amidohydrolase
MTSLYLAASLQALEQRGQTIATAESLTAGQVCAAIADVPGASAVLRGGLSAYATEVKVSVLGVDPEIVEQYGVVSRECAEAMALAANTLFGTDWAVSTTGVAGPTGQEDKPVGTVYVAVASGTQVTSRDLLLSGDRVEIRAAATDAVLTLLAEALDDSYFESARARTKTAT